MGVPRLFPWLVKMFPKSHIHFRDGSYFLTVDNLYLDANGLLHTAAQIVFNYGDGKRKIDPNGDLTYTQKIKKVYSTFFQMIKTVASIVVPTKILYIAIDGPAPLAKQAQQRQRRFISALSSSSSGSEWDSTSITPGTTFMFELTKYMHFAIRKQLNTHPKSGGWSHNLEVLFSPPTVPGEGEHKIMNYIRSIPMEEATEMTHCMFGPDGDLIMLTLAAHLPKMFLFRSDQYQPGFYDILDMGLVRNGLCSVLKLHPNISDKKEVSNKKDVVIQKPAIDDVVNDFILLGFFVGNDFLPKLQMFTYLEDGLSLVLSLYTKFSNDSNEPNTFLTMNNDISFTSSGMFKTIVTDMARRESWYLQDQSKIKPADPRFKDNTLLRNIRYPKNEKSGSTGTLDFENFRRDYYAKSDIKNVGNIGDPSPEVRGICLEYLKSMYWVFEYYVKGIPSWSHYYSRYYAPLMTDLSHVLDTLSIEEEDSIKLFDKGEPSVPFVQLLSIIAPKNVSLLPKPFHSLMTSPVSPLVKAGYYPKNFEIDYEGKTKEHMGVALLPFINVDEVRKNYAPVAKTLRNTYVRNSIGSLEKFVYDEFYTATYKSDYGILKNMKIRKTDISE